MKTEFYREQFEYEIDCNNKMLAMLEGVPAAMHSNPLYQRALSIADHLTACRENWLDLMLTGGLNQGRWYNETAELATIKSRFTKMHLDWQAFLSGLTDEELAIDRKFPEGGGITLWYYEGQIIQLNGHAHYHRGQVTLIVDMLGGDVVDTDYADYIFGKSDKYGWTPGS